MTLLLKLFNALISIIQPAINKYMEEGTKAAEPEDVLFSIAQACDFLFIHERKLRRLKHSGAISCIQVGRTPIYSKKELLRYMRENS